jgi:purine-cytosine permease-like protein
VNRGQVFARYETRFQFGWVIGATVPVVIAIPGALGYLLVGLIASGGVLRYRTSPRRPVRRRQPSPPGRRSSRR